MPKFVSNPGRWAMWVLLVTSLSGAAWAEGDTPAASTKATPRAESGAETETATKTAKPQRPKRPRVPILSIQTKTLASKLDVLPADEDPEIMHFWGTCGASSAVALDGRRVIIGSDDDNFLRTYDIIGPDKLFIRDEAGKVDRSRSGLNEPRAAQNLYKFLRVNQYSHRHMSAIEGVAENDDYVFWITSHARRHDGETRANRRRFFAMKKTQIQGVTVLELHGQAVLDLAHRMESDDSIKKSGLRNSIMAQYRRLEHLAPDQRGIDIQGLAMAPDGKTLWIALRNPQRASRAQIVPLKNPEAVVLGEPPVFDTPFSLDLGGRGIAFIEWVPDLGEYLIVAGKAGESTGLTLHRWTGDPTSRPTAGQPMPGDLDVQSLIVTDGGTRALLFSDDSKVKIAVRDKKVCQTKLDEDGLCACNRTEGQGQKRFRARWMSLEALKNEPATR